MTTQAAPNTANGFVPQEPITCIVTPNLPADQAATLLSCINKVRAGERVYYVRLTYHKVTNAPKRLPPQDYVEDPALRPHAHEGFLVEARVNKKGRLFMRLHDEARRPPEVTDRDYGYTCFLLDGIESFKVLGERAGPAEVKRQQAEPQPTISQQQAVPPFQPNVQAALAMQAQGMFMMGQAMVQMAQAMMGQVQPPQQAHNPQSGGSQQ